MPWLVKLAIFLGLEACWFALLHPLIPSTLLGFTAEFTAGLAVFALIFGGGWAIIWLNGRSLNRTFTKAVSVAIAVGVGIAIFAAAYFCRIFLTNDFAFWH